MSGGCLETSRSDYSVTQLVIPEERNVQVHRFDNHITRKIAYIKKISCRTLLHDHILSLGNVAEHKQFCFRQISTGCPTRYRNRHVFNKFTVSQQLGARQTRTTDTFLFISHTTNVPLFKFRCNIFIGVRIINEMPGSVASGTSCIFDCSVLPCATLQWQLTA